AVAHFAAEEEGLEPIVGRACENHAAEDLNALVGRQRRLDRHASEESVALLDERRVRLGESPLRAHARRGLRQSARKRRLYEPLGQLAAEPRPQRFESRLPVWTAPAGRRLAPA